jgi:predicted ester cyclase
MTTDEIARNKKIVDAFIQELFTAGDPTAVDRYLDPGFVDHDPTVPGTSGPDTMRQAEAMIRAALPDWRSELDDLVGEGDIVVERFTASGTHTGPLWGVPPTGKRLVLPGINIFRLVDGVIVERWGRVDEAGLLRQLGLVPG